jgi:hypothetical protein
MCHWLLPDHIEPFEQQFVLWFPGRNRRQFLQKGKRLEGEKQLKSIAACSG